MDMIDTFPSVLTFQGVSVTLENNSVWKKFCHCGTEMILTKQGRRMFPYCRYRLSGLDPAREYSLVLSIVPVGQYRYRWSTSKWEVHGPAEHQAQSLIRAFAHHYSPCRGSDWMSSLVSFYKLKLTNNLQDQDGHIILHSMHRYIPRLHIIPIPDDGAATPDQPVVMGPESMTFTFPQTEFMAVTTYQNFRITQLKINHNPFAKGFREDGNNPRLNRILTEAQPVAKTEAESAALKPAESSEHEEEVVDLSSKSNSGSASLPCTQEIRLVLKPIMSNPASTGEPYVPCMRGKHALGELVLVQRSAEPQEENATCPTPEKQQGLKVPALPKASSVTPSSSTSTPGSSLRCRKKKRRMKRRWATSRGRVWKAAAISPAAVHSPSLTVAMQPELDEVEGLLFVSFTSKEALEAHINDKTASTSSSESPVSLTTPIQAKPTMEVNPETVEEKMARLESVLLSDLKVFKHRQVIHPVLQKVGLKLSSLDPALSIDLQYLGICLPLPPPNLPEQSSTAALSPADEGLPFVSRTGKTSDVTKIKGWKNKFVRSKDTSTTNCEEGLPKNLSAFCSNMLDEYLESEAQQISERAAAFSTNSEGSVAYQLPAKSSSYVKTLDSALRHRNAASKITIGDNKPCPLSYKRPLSAAPAVSASTLASPSTPSPAEPQSKYQLTPSHSHPEAASSFNYVSQRCVDPAINATTGSHLSVRKLHIYITALNLRFIAFGLSPILMQTCKLKVATFSRSNAKRHECGRDFCRLGCVCSSLQTAKRHSVHCRRPECMLSCTCQIAKQENAGERDQQNHPVNSKTSVEHGSPQPGSHTLKLWNRTILDEDPEPIFTPKSAPTPLLTVKVVKRCLPHPTQQIREEDKDPVYKYLESLMTCARVREFNSKPPPVMTLDTKISDFISALNNTAKVNGKHYNQARLYLGNMGSLHPANRFAAYVTGRLKPHHHIPHTPESTHRTSLPGSLHIKAAVPPVAATHPNVPQQLPEELNIFIRLSHRLTGTEKPQLPWRQWDLLIQNLSSIQPHH
ncbi:MAX gene-associated protein [Xenentodon cancila]